MNIPDFEVIGMKGNSHLPEVLPATGGTQPLHLKARMSRPSCCISAKGAFKTKTALCREKKQSE